MGETASDTNASPEGQPDERGQVSQAAGVLASMTMVSRVAGLVRDAVISAVFGAGAGADAFFVAFRIPNLFRRVVAEGATSAAFVPVFSESLRNAGPMAAVRTAGAVGGGAVLVLAGLTLAGMWAAGGLTALFAPGFSRDPAQQALTVSLTRWTFPYLLLVGTAAWAMGVHHTFRRFALPAAGPVVMNLSMIGFALVLAPRLAVPAWALVAGVLVGGVAQVLLQVPSLWRQGLRPWMFLRLRHRAVARCARLVVAALLGGSVYQVNVLLATVFASLLPTGTVSYLWYADRLFEFPLGVVAVAVGTAALPSLSSQAAARRFDAMTDTVVHALSLTIAFCMPAAAGLWVLSHEITSLLFERGSFGPDETAMTAWAVRASVPGLIAVGIVRVLSAAFFALERPRIPVAAGLLAMAASAVLSVALMGPPVPGPPWWGSALLEAVGPWLRVADLRHAGLALATALAASINAVVLLVLLRRLLPGFPLRPLARSLGLHGVAAAGMALVLRVWLGLGALWEFPGATAVVVAGGIGLGGSVYLLVAARLGSREIRDLAAGVAGLRPGPNRSES